jgi:hypothetical protein
VLVHVVVMVVVPTATARPCLGARDVVARQLTLARAHGLDLLDVVVVIANWCCCLEAPVVPPA